MRLLAELRYSVRQLRSTPGFTVIVLATLGLCIGANTAIFSLLDAVLLRPVPYPSPERLGIACMTLRENGKEEIDDSQTGAMFEAVRDGAPQLEVAAFGLTSGVNFSGQGHLEFVQQARVSAGYFHVLGVPPQFGREFSSAEDIAGGPPVVVLSYAFWQRVFQGQPAALGRAITLRGQPYTIVGIMPKDFRADQPADVWTPLRPSRLGEGSGNNYGVVARLKPGATWSAANEQLRSLSAVMRAAPGFPREWQQFEERLLPLQKGLTQARRAQILLTWGAVLVLLIIGCVNVAGLVLARSMRRRREIATRLALGASRSAIVRQLLAESLLLALGGGCLGVALGVKAIGWLKDLGAAEMQLWHPIQMDARVLIVMLAVSAITSVLFGLVPAIQTSRLDIRSVIIEGGRGAGARQGWPRRALVGVEVALSLVLLVSAGLLVRTLAYLDGLNPGFDTRNVITAQVSLQDARYQTAADVNRLYASALDRIRAIPGVQSATVALTLPYERPLNLGVRPMDGDDSRGRSVEAVYAAPGYFATMRIPLRHGRVFRDTDAAGGTPVAVVSESFARRFYSTREALGGHLAIGGATREIVGIVGDVQQHSGLGNFGPVSIDPTVYIPSAQTNDGFLRLVHTWFSPKFVIRTAGPVGAIETQVQSAVAAIDPQLPIARFQTIDDLRGRVTLEQRYHAGVFSAVAGLALLLAALGLYGLISNSVAHRRHELGVRMALGASAFQAMAASVKPGVVLALAGVAGGYVLSRIAARFLAHLLWGVRPGDPTTFVTTSALLVFVALLASAAPAVRILRIDPAQTLRDE